MQAIEAMRHQPSEAQLIIVSDFTLLLKMHACLQAPLSV